MDGVGATKAVNAKAKRQNLMTEAGQSSPSPLAGISQSEGAALETCKTEQNEVNKTEKNGLRGKKKKKNVGNVGCGGKKEIGRRKMQRKHIEC